MRGLLPKLSSEMEALVEKCAIQNEKSVNHAFGRFCYTSPKPVSCYTRDNSPIPPPTGYEKSKKSKIDQSMSGNDSHERSMSNHDVSVASLIDDNISLFIDA